ncbi:MAG: DUF2470 domain-containing protein [Gammaproteobacteria bacterium]|nr:DUF2470 domain-containing protein [Gammaproteobacteria bacterium]
MARNTALPPLSEAARTLVATQAHGVLSTLRSDDGYPYGSVVDYLPLINGNIVLLLSDLAEHRKYLSRDPRASLLIAPGMDGVDQLAENRLTLLGQATPVDDRLRYRADYLVKHPQASQYIDFSDFNFFCLQVERVRFIAGFGRMGWLEATDYAQAAPDPLSAIAASALAHMNADHGQNLCDYARAFADRDWASECRMTSVDRFGFNMLCAGDGRRERIRIGFASALTDASQLRPTLVAMAQQAREILADRDGKKSS